MARFEPLLVTGKQYVSKTDTSCMFPSLEAPEIVEVTLRLEPAIGLARLAIKSFPSYALKLWRELPFGPAMRNQ